MTPELTPAAGISSDAATYMYSAGIRSNVAAVTARELPDTDSIGDEELLLIAQKRFKLSVSADQSWRDQAVNELNFCDNLEHWTEEAKTERQGQPCMIFDLIGPKVAQVVNDARQAPPEIKFVPVGSGGDKEEAKILMGLNRNIDNDSAADVARETAFEFAVKIGRGWWREDFEWENNDPEPNDASFYQKLVTRRIANPFSVYHDPSSVEFDFSDMGFCFITEDLDKDAFDEEYGDSSSISAMGGNFEGVGNSIRDDWFPNGAVRVAEYFWLEIDRSHLYLMSDGRKLKFEDLKDGDHPVMRRVVEKRTINWAKLTGMDVLERKKWVGKYIPLIGVVGKEILKDGKRSQVGMIRAAIDPQKSYDYMRSKECQAIGLAPLSQWLVAEGSIEGHEWKYADSNRKTFAYLTYRQTDSMGEKCNPPTRINSGVDIGGITQAIAHASQDVMSVMNVFAPDTGQPVADQSGKAIGLRTRQSDNAHFNYTDNYARAMRHSGRVRLDLIPYIYSEDRIISIFDPDGKVRAMRVNGRIRPEDNIKAAVDKIVDLRTAPSRYDVVVGTGPGYATQREEGFAQFIQLAQIDPTIVQKAGDIAVRASNSPYADEIADRIAPPGVQGGDQQPIPPAALAQIQQLTTLNQQLIQSVKALTDTINQKQLELASRERISAGDRAARIEGIAIQARSTLEAAALKSGHDADSMALDAEMRAIENQQDHIETSAQMELTARLAREEQQHQKDLQASQQTAAPGAGPQAPPAGQ